jgi:hypothetical protein
VPPCTGRCRRRSCGLRLPGPGCGFSIGCVLVGGDGGSAAWVGSGWRRRGRVLLPGPVALPGWLLRSRSPWVGSDEGEFSWPVAVVLPFYGCARAHLGRRRRGRVLSPGCLCVAFLRSRFGSPWAAATRGSSVARSPRVAFLRLRSARLGRRRRGGVLLPVAFALPSCGWVRARVLVGRFGENRSKK